MECSIINPALSILMKHLVIGQRQKAYFSAFHWSPHGSLFSISQHFVTRRVVHLQKKIETSLITEADPTSNQTWLCVPCIAAIAGLSLHFFLCTVATMKKDKKKKKISKPIPIYGQVIPS